MNASIRIADWEEHWGGEQAGRAAWAALRETGPARPLWIAPAWQYEDVPEDLRDPSPYDHDELSELRVAWLNAHPWPWPT
jgi:hypothetical protein